MYPNCSRRSVLTETECRREAPYPRENVNSGLKSHEAVPLQTDRVRFNLRVNGPGALAETHKERGANRDRKYSGSAEISAT